MSILKKNLIYRGRLNDEKITKELCKFDCDFFHDFFSYDVTYYSRDGFEVGDTVSVHDYNDYYFDLNSSTNFFGARTDFTYLEGNSEYTFHINV
ncbi:hypothetical protein [Brassicibacter mesophilus]|uniref:hypothetical protein n=1 Tax=Brassicibacter mesophilus TaxID=745119 RepID=UPI003D1D8CE5